MKQTLLALFTLLIMSGCGGGTNTTASTKQLSELLAAKTFYSIEDNVNNRSIYTIGFDKNLTSWNINSYDSNYSTPKATPIDNNITVTDDSIVNKGGLIYRLKETTTQYMNFASLVNPLISLRLFNQAKDAQDYYDITLKNELKGKEFFVVQNDLNKRSLFKITINPTAEQWDILSYDTNYSTPSSSAYGLAIVVNDTNLTDSGGSKFAFNTKTTDYLRIASTVNPLVTLRFYTSKDTALAYFNEQDLRVELRSKSFFAVGNFNSKKTLYQFNYNATLSTWNFKVYGQDYSTAPTTDANSTITVTQDRLIETGGDTMYLKEKTADYIEIDSATTQTSLFRLYTKQENALSYFKQK